MSGVSFGRLGQHRISGGERSGNLPDEDGKWGIPRANAHDRTERRTGILPKLIADLVTIVSQKIDGLSHFAHGVRDCPPAFTNDHLDQLRHPTIEKVRSAL